MITPNLESDELEHLKELQEVHELFTSTGWRTRIMPLLQEQVEQAKEAMVGNISSDPMTYMRLQLRWQQREAMLRELVGYIDGCEQQRKRILEEIEERRKEAAGILDSVPVEENYA